MALPAATDFTGASITEGQFKTALTSLISFLSGLLGTDGVASTALAALGAFAAGVEAKTSAYTVTAADRGKILLCTGTWTLSLPPAATAGDGFLFCVKNAGSGAITLDADASETIDGELTATLENTGAATMLLVCDGTAWYGLSKPEETPYGTTVLETGSSTYKGSDDERYMSIASYTTALSAYGAVDYLATQDDLSATATMCVLRCEHFGTVTASIYYKAVTYTGYARVLKNGSQIQQWTASSLGSYYHSTVDIDVAPGDTIEFQVRTTSATYGKMYAKLMRLLITQLTP